jgi:hypothetical protein
MANTKTPKSYDELSGTKTGTYEEALASRKIRDGFSDGAPTPDTPTGAAVYVNPALEDGPSRAPVPETVSVPVVNDPGLLASRPSLADLNAANRGITFPRAVIPMTDGEPLPDLDPTAGITEESHREDIRAAAQDRQDAIVDGTKELVKNAESDAAKAAPAPAKSEPTPPPSSKN